MRRFPRFPSPASLPTLPCPSTAPPQPDVRADLVAALRRALGKLCRAQERRHAVRGSTDRAMYGVCRRRLRLRRHRRTPRPPVSPPCWIARPAGRGSPPALRYSTRGPSGPGPARPVRVPACADPSPSRRVRPPAPGIGRGGSDPRIVDWRPGSRCEPRSISSPAPAAASCRATASRCPLSVTAHADGVRNPLAQRLPRHLPAGRRRGSRAIRLRGCRAARGRGSARNVAAPNCPSGAMDVLLAPDQMILQIHESSGIAGARPHPGRRAQLRRHELRHPGHVRHVSLRPDLLNITFDPTRPEEPRARSTTTARARKRSTSSQRHPAAPAGRAISQGRGLPVWRTRVRTAGTGRRSTAWPT
jgi:hypothetical protein